MQTGLFESDDDPSVSGTSAHPTPATSLITYGKLKGQPLDLLLMQPDYAIWLLTAKYSLLQKNHPGLLTWLLKRYGAPETTPEHNILQNRFLEPSFCLQLLLHLHPELPGQLLPLAAPGRMEKIWSWAIPRRLAAAYETYYLPYDWSADKPLPESHHRHRQRALAQVLEESRRVRREATSRAARQDELSALGLPAETALDPKLHQIWEPVLKVSDPAFEVEGADVAYSASAGMWVDVESRSNHLADVPLTEFSFKENLRVEVKPFVGDDYPVILRAMVARKCNVLLVERFEAGGASWEQVVKVFASRSIRAVLLEDVLLTPIPDCVLSLPLFVIDHCVLEQMVHEAITEYDRSWVEQALQRKQAGATALKHLSERLGGSARGVESSGFDD